MALTNIQIPDESSRYKWTGTTSDPVVGIRNLTFRPPKFRTDFKYTNHTVKFQDIGRLDLLSNMYYGISYFWWAIAWVNHIRNPLTDMHTASGEKTKASVGLLDTNSDIAVVASSKLQGSLGNSLSVSVEAGTSVGYLIVISIGADNKYIYDNAVLYPETDPNYLPTLANENTMIQFDIANYSVPLDVTLPKYDLSGGESWTESQVIKIPSKDEIEYALANSLSNDT